MIILSLLTLNACGFKSNLMTPAQNDQSTNLADNISRITFYRPSSFGAAIQAPIVEQENSEIKLCGIASYGTKFHYIVNPGKHDFIIGGEYASLLKAEIAPNKNYYVKVIPMMGFWKARFCFEPMSQNQLKEEKIRKEIKSCSLVTPNESAKTWLLENRNSLIIKANEAKKSFENIKEKDKSKYILDSKDCIDELL